MANAPRFLPTSAATLLMLLVIWGGSAALAHGSAASAPSGYIVTNEGGIRFADEYERLGGVDALGYPSSNRFQLPDGFTYQLTQAALLQWRPERDGVALANSFEWLERACADDWLYSFKGVPRPIKDDGSGGDWLRAKEARLSWLTNDAIRAQYLANPDPGAFPAWTVEDSIELYGLPMSRPERFGPFITQRFQRISWQLWLDDVPGMPPSGTVVRILAGDLLKEAGLIPTAALLPEDRPTPTLAATDTGVPNYVPASTPTVGVDAGTPTAAATPTSTPRSVPTPDPSHPPQTGVFRQYFEYGRSPVVQVCSGSCSTIALSHGPFHNLAFTSQWVGKTLVVKRLEFTCPTGSPSCQHPPTTLYRSYVGELRDRLGVFATSSDGVRREHLTYDAVAVATESPEDNTLTWRIQEGQYFLYWPSSGPYPISPTYQFVPLPASVGYAVEIY